jgi:hypothetical protein
MAIEGINTQQRMKIPKHDRALEGRKQQRVAAKAAADKVRDQARHAGERLRFLDRRCLSDEHELQRERQHQRTQRGIAHLRRGPPEERKKALDQALH